jgi:hypothetical protein
VNKASKGDMTHIAELRISDMLQHQTASSPFDSGLKPTMRAFPSLSLLEDDEASMTERCCHFEACVKSLSVWLRDEAC